MTTATHAGTAIQQAARHLAEGRADAAIPLLEQAAGDFPTYVTAHVLLARAYESARRPDDALEAWHRAHFLMPTSRLIRRQRERLLARRAAALTGLQQPAAHPPKTQPEGPTTHADELGDELGQEWTWDTQLPDEPPVIDQGDVEEDLESTEGSLVEAPEPSGETNFEIGDEPPEAAIPEEDFLAVDETTLEDLEADLQIPDEVDAAEDWVRLEEDDQDDDDDVIEAEVIPPMSPRREDTPPPEEDGNGWRISAESESHDPPRYDPPSSATEEPPPQEESPPPSDPLDELEDLDALIDQLERAPRIKPAGDEGGAAEEDDDIEDELVTETLARIYEAQGQLAAAADAYDRLARQHPDRASEFEQRADELRRREQA